MLFFTGKISIHVRQSACSYHQIFTYYQVVQCDLLVHECWRSLTHPRKKRSHQNLPGIYVNLTCITLSSTPQKNKRVSLGLFHPAYRGPRTPFIIAWGHFSAMKTRSGTGGRSNESWFGNQVSYHPGMILQGQAFSS